MDNNRSTWSTESQSHWGRILLVMLKWMAEVEVASVCKDGLE